MDDRYWQTLQELLTSTKLVIDRPKGQAHPRYPELIYPLDYGYLDGTTSGDSAGIDVWVGSLENRKLTGILCTFDTFKRDAEVKLLSGCSEKDVETILGFNTVYMRYLYISKP